MGTAKQDFERFVRWLHQPEQNAPEAVRRFANLVLANFSGIATTARQHNNRSNLLARLAREHLATTGAHLPPLQEAAPHGEWPWMRLRHFTLGPFRGFREPQGFDLSKRLVLCYGANGSGKSSFCEALEFALLGSIQEAESKRIADVAYLTNIHAGRFDAPVLTAVDANGGPVDVRPDEEKFRFFFIEKNRIDNFSRIAATPPGRRSDLIATLFGMDQFNDFTAHFNESMDAVLTLGTPLQVQLNGSRQALVADQEVVATEAVQLATIDETATVYAGAFADELTFAGLKEMVGSDETPGRLQQLNDRLRTVPPAPIGISQDKLVELYINADGAADSMAAATTALNERRNQVSFRNLYTAVQSLRATNPDQCPACLTPIGEATQNPYERATTGLRELAEVATLEANLEEATTAQRVASEALRAELQKLQAFLEDAGERESAVCAYLIGLPANPGASKWWTSIYSPEADATGATPALEQILEVADRARAQDIAAEEARTARESDAAEQQRLNDARVWIAEYETTRTRIISDATQARARITQWEQTNANLIERAAQEGTANNRDRPIKEGYDGFYSFIDRFCKQLPSMLMADLNATTMELYNEFNHGDRDEDKLADLLLPLTGDGIMEIAFRGNPQRRVNALATLSEGHIRCLGLAILLAKAQSIGTPLIIFDDAINAIDHDHRSGIRAALFESGRFRDTQIIVTCHSAEFIKDVENHLPATDRGNCQQYVLQNHDGNYQPRVNPDVGSLNYLTRARQAMDRFDSRDALSFARKALEMLTQKIWKWLESHRIAPISVQLDGPGKEIQLRALCESLRSKLNSSTTFAHVSKQPLTDNLNVILGIPEQTLVWTLLNKGTHEEPDRDDFDRNQVETVVAVLERIDALELRRGR